MTPEKGDWPKWASVFLVAFAQSGIVTEAAKEAGRSRKTVYLLREKDDSFREAWACAEEQAADELEGIARKRAEEGSDTLLIFLLKARRPERFRERMTTRHEGGITVDHDTIREAARTIHDRDAAARDQEGAT